MTRFVRHKPSVDPRSEQRNISDQIKQLVMRTLFRITKLVVHRTILIKHQHVPWREMLEQTTSDQHLRFLLETKSPSRRDAMRVVRRISIPFDRCALDW